MTLCIDKEEVDDEDAVFELAPPTDSEEIKEDQWMGVTVRSQSIGGKVREHLAMLVLELLIRTTYVEYSKYIISFNVLYPPI